MDHAKTVCKEIDDLREIKGLLEKTKKNIKYYGNGLKYIKKNAVKFQETITDFNFKMKEHKEWENFRPRTSNGVRDKVKLWDGYLEDYEEMNPKINKSIHEEKNGFDLDRDPEKISIQSDSNLRYDRVKPPKKRISNRKMKS